MKNLTADGKQTDTKDPNRMVWYGDCGYWTDNWEKLGKTSHSIPCCPTCKRPGYQGTYLQWILGVKQFDTQEHPGYHHFVLNEGKEACGELQKWMEEHYPDEEALKKHQILATEWGEYAKYVYPDGFGNKNQADQVKQAFYGGTWFLINRIIQRAGTLKSDEALLVLLADCKAMYAESLAFKKEVESRDIKPDERAT